MRKKKEKKRAQISQRKKKKSNQDGIFLANELWYDRQYAMGNFCFYLFFFLLLLLLFLQQRSGIMNGIGDVEAVYSAMIVGWIGLGSFFFLMGGHGGGSTWGLLLPRRGK